MTELRQQVKALLSGIVVLLGVALGPVVQTQSLRWPQDYVLVALFLAALALKYLVVEPMMPKKNGQNGNGGGVK